MKKKLRVLGFLVLSFLCYYSATSFYDGQITLSSSQPPTGYTGASGVYCNSCHLGGFNSPGGSVVVAGLPQTYEAGKLYNFSITATHFAADRFRWGFSIIAINNAGNPVGVFSSTNPNAAPNGNELSHHPAVTTSALASYTYNNLRWTAPTAPGPNDMTIRFYYVANAANGNTNTTGDYIYSAFSTAVYSPVYTFNGNGNWSDVSNWNNSLLPPANLMGNAEIIISPVNGGKCILNINQQISAGAKLTISPGANFEVPGEFNINN